VKLLLFFSHRGTILNIFVKGETAQMSSVATPPQPPVDDLVVKWNKRTKRLSIALIILATFFVLSLVCGIFVIRWKLNAIDKAEKNLAFGQFVTDYNAAEDFVQPTVNTIQFLRRGYSIFLERVEYTQNGLVLSGQVGNPTHLWISSLALNFSARPYPYKIREKWDKSGFPWWDADWNIGTAQTTVGALNPGSTTPFEVTIPNVKQTSDTIQIAVSFSGERYQYLGR
jgi:hypothetical protein